MRKRRDQAVLRQVGARIAAARVAGGWTQQALAEAVGLSEAVVVSRIEQGSRGVTLDTLLQIAKALDVPVGSLLDSAGPHPAPGRKADEAQLLEKFSKLSPVQRKLLVRLAGEMVKE